MDELDFVPLPAGVIVVLRALARQCTIVFASESELTLLTSPAGTGDA